MAETVSACYLGLPAEEQKRIMVERITEAPPEMADMLGVQLCDRTSCTLSAAGIIRAGFTRTHAPHLLPTRDADFAMELPPDCERFQGGARLQALNDFASAYREDPEPGCVRVGIQEVIDATGGRGAWERTTIQGEIGCRVCIHAVMCVDGGRAISASDFTDCPELLPPSDQPY